mmetsp:Transcript_9238/g.14284  ORF Transcript_9238/g.14284 Transcript_9238/m.14284 type:complete len:90 (+) Transcript_9238:65-334(+)
MNAATAYGLGESPDQPIKVDHVFTFAFDKKWDNLIQRSADAWLRLGSHVAESFRYVAIGVGLYFVLLGCSRILEASKTEKKNDADENET